MTSSAVLLACLVLLHCQGLVSGLNPQLSLTDSIDIAESKPWMDTSLDPHKRADLLLSAMTTQEMHALVRGDSMDPYVGHTSANERLNIPPLNMHDGPQGYRTHGAPNIQEGTATSFPGGMAMAATWDDGALYDWGVAMGKEFRMKGGNVQLGPGFNLVRAPLNGRNFEYTVGEDPYLGYRLAKPVVAGIQNQNVIACAKHWVVNSQEDHRMDGSEDVDERTLFEVYYPPFEGAVEAGVGSVMCSYQKINGIYSCENNETLAGHLKTDLQFDGFVMSDWGATHSPSFRQGLDQEMPFGIQTNDLALAFSPETASDDDIDQAVHRILRTMFKVGLFDQPATTWDKAKAYKNVTTAESQSVARELGVKSTVLLKNDGNVLPLPKGSKIALIGFAADNARPLSYGHGSGEVPPSYYVSPLEGILAAAGDGAEVTFDKGTDLQKAATLAKDADYAIVFVGSSATEGADRLSLSLDNSCEVSTFGQTLPCDGNDANQNGMIDAVAGANPNTIVVLSIPGAVVMKWSPTVPAILTNFMPGEQVGNALADILFGKENPAARLPITMPNGFNDLEFQQAQWPGVYSPDGTTHFTYSEKLLVGYRFYEEHKINFTTGFPFGHGLSYTSFTYSDLDVTKRGTGEFSVTIQVTNVGKVPGADIPQLYLSFPSSAGEPALQLKGFQKTAKLMPGESQQVTLHMPPRAFSIWNIEQHKWAMVTGTFVAHIGASSRDLRLMKDFEV